MRLTSLLIICLIASCGQNAETEQDDIDATTDKAIVADSSSLNMEQENLKKEYEAQRYFYWDIDFDRKTKEKNPDFIQENLSVDSFIKGLNMKYANIPLKKVNIRNDTLDIQVLNSQYLTERMGSSGAASYLADAVINLTTVTGLNFVKINFTEGSHASPGIFSKQSYVEYKEMK